MKIILASKSPRRREILSRVGEENGFSFEIITKETDETLNGEVGAEAAEILAVRKGRAVWEENRDALVVSSDTLVELDGINLGKPKDKYDAVRMLRALSGRRHNVHTGVAVHYRGKVFSGVDTTAVYFRELGEKEIEEYVKSGEPMDKAGAYGIQGAAGKFVSRYDGEFDTVVGLSVTLLKKILKDAMAEGCKNE